MDELATKDVDIAACFALPRRVLYGGALVVIAYGLALSMFFACHPSLARWLLPAIPFSLTLTAIGLRASAAGRGLLWVMGRGKSPTTSVVIGALVTAVSVVVFALHG